MKALFYLALAFLLAGCATRPTPRVASSTVAGDSIYVINGTSAERRVPLLNEPALHGLHYVTIVGVVARPGVYFFSGSLSLLSLLKIAGTDADVEASRPFLYGVRITRQAEGGEIESFLVNAHTLRKLPNGDRSCLLRGGELVYVPAELGM